MHIDLPLAAAMVMIGVTVGLTGMGGGALMTPVLVLVFHVEPFAAISSDLVASLVMRPVGAAVHIRRGTVRWELVRMLAIGSVPAAFAGVFVLRSFGNSESLQNNVKIALGATLLLAALAMGVRGWLQVGQRRRAREAGISEGGLGRMHVKPLPTVLIGVLGGLLVGMTSVGSGSVVIVCLILVYPQLRGGELVGTDLVQAVPLVAAASLAHIFFGQFELSLTASILLGAIPGVYVGARMSSKAPDWLIRPALVFVLLATGLKLVGVPTSPLSILMVAFALVALPLWGAVDAASHPAHQWEGTGLSRASWIRVQALGAPFVIGFAAAIAYFARTRPRLQAIALPRGRVESRATARSET